MKIISGENFILKRFIGSGEYAYFLAGRKISVETFAVEAGGHDFNYQVMSRATSHGNPESILTTRKALEKEFHERRYVHRTFAPVSIDLGPNGPNAEITYGEISPQIYESEVDTDIVAWSIEFLWHRLAKAGGARLSPWKKVRSQQGVTVGRGTAKLNALPDLAAHLRVYVPSADGEKYQSLGKGFGTTDVIGVESDAISGWLTRVFSK